jgi:hypothetical protein
METGKRSSGEDLELEGLSLEELRMTTRTW